MNFKQFLFNLVNFDTVSKNSNLSLISYVEYHLKKLGFTTEQKLVGNKANLFAYKKPNNRIIFAAHTDTVPPSPKFESDPYDLLFDGEKYIGLGVADMKGFLALALEVASEYPVDDRLAFLLTFDEEQDFGGAKSIPPGWIKPNDTVILGEPTDLLIIPCHKGLIQYEITLTGQGGHGSEPDCGISAILEMAKFITYFESGFKKLFKNANANFENPLPTFNIGLIRGGEAVNIIPENAQIDLDVRITNPQDQKMIEQLFTNFKSPGKLEWEEKVFVPPFFSAFTKVSNLGKGVSYTTEASFLQKYTTKILLFGPGEFSQAHIANESLPLKNVEKYKKKLLQYLDQTK